MSKSLSPSPADFSRLLKEVKARIQQSQMRAILAVNAELVRLYWDIGRMIDQRQKQEGWGAAVIPRLARELRSELPEVKGFSERNIKSMLAFFREYPDPPAIVQQAVAQLPAAEKLPRRVAKLEAATKAQQPTARFLDSILWSIPWGHHILLMLKVRDRSDRLWYMRETLANGWSRNVLLLMVKSGAHSRQGLSRTSTSTWPSLTTISATRRTHPRSACQDRNHIVAEYALRGMNKPIGVSEYEGYDYELTRVLPASLRSALPTVEEIEWELGEKRGRGEQTPGQETDQIGSQAMIAATSMLGQRKTVVTDIDDL